jgi:hypothetical protein
MKLKIMKSGDAAGTHTTFASGGYCKARGDHSYPSAWEGTARPPTPPTPSVIDTKPGIEITDAVSVANTLAVQALVVTSAVASVVMRLPPTSSTSSSRRNNKQNKIAKPAEDKN